MDSPPDLSKLDHAQKDALIVSLFATVARLEKRLAKLEDQAAKNSSNSSKPSSTDGLKKPEPKSRRNRSGKRSGAQPGHSGTTLERVAEPDYRIDHEPEYCTGCGATLEDAALVAEQRRQVFDIPR